MICTKKRKRNKYKRGRQTSLLREYRQYCRNVEIAVKSDRAKYGKKMFHSKQYKYKEISQHVDKRKKISSRILSLKHDGNETTKHDDEREALSQDYSYVFTADNNILPSCLPKLPLIFLLTPRLMMKLMLLL